MYRVAFWKQAPFFRILVPWITGILLQWYLRVWQVAAFVIFISSVLIVFLLGYLLRSSLLRFRFGWISGMVQFILLLSLSVIITHSRDIKNESKWFGHGYHSGDTLLLTLQETLVEKPNSYKALATINGCKGKIIIYFKKDSSIRQLGYGSQIMFSQPLQEIKNAGNPGGFDYKQYCRFHDITHQVYLKPEDITLLPQENKQWLRKELLQIHAVVLGIIQKYIPDKKEQGLAEALLIGYKNDLDKELVQSYTDTGVAHIIAISGLHLALLYWLLMRLFFPLKRWKHGRLFYAVIVISILWIFSLLAGAQPSLLRAALMFSLIVIGEVINRKANLINSLAAAAFAMLCINPYWLWDLGFQLSFLALLSLAIFMRPIYDWFWFDNKLLRWIWALVAASIAAQLLTLPISIYHFHQLPVYFILSNLGAVPLSSLIVLLEVFLCAFSWIEPIAVLLGDIISFLIRMMNTWIERIESLPFAVWDGLQITIIQTVLLYTMITGVGYWLLKKRKWGARLVVVSFVLFMMLRAYSFIEADKQSKLIVYNVSKHSAIDIVDGRNYFFVGDSLLLQDEFLRNFNLKPSRILHRINRVEQLPDLIVHANEITWKNKRIVILVDPTVSIDPSASIDLLILSKDSDPDFCQYSNVKQIVFDASLPRWKILDWKEEGGRLRIPFHDVAEQGAYILNYRSSVGQ